MAKRISELSRSEWQAACMRDARKCHELDIALDTLESDGCDVAAFDTARILAEARNQLLFFGDGGIAGEEMADGCSEARAAYRQLTAFVRKWTKLRQQRAQWILARK